MQDYVSLTANLSHLHMAKSLAVLLVLCAKVSPWRINCAVTSESV